MYNKTSASLMLQTIMVLMEKQNGTLPLSDDLERCYGNYGCFSIAYPWTCSNRPDNYFPLTPESMAIRYPIFTRRNRRTPVFLKADNIELIQNANIDPAGPFYLISHGFLEGGHKAWIQDMSNALLNIEGNDAATVIVVDWLGGSQPPYGQAVANIRLIGVMTAHLIKNIYETLGLSDVDNFHFVGHSLGAHLAGYCGYALKKEFGLKLGRITGLDPAGPHFAGTVSLVHLDKSDAKYVDIIHTNAKPLYVSGLGMEQPIGHVDFYPNGGSEQPGCGPSGQAGVGGDISPTVTAMLGCNHVRSHKYFTESIAPNCPFIGVQCESYEEFLAGNCSTCDQKHACMPMGYYSQRMYRRLLDQGLLPTARSIKLYSITGSSKPFCRVHYKVTLKISNTTNSRSDGPESGQVSITLVDRNNNKSEPKLVDEKQKYYKPGDLETRIVAVKDTGLPPQYVIADWKYVTNLFNPMTWRLIKSPRIHLDYIKVSSIEYNTDITACPKLSRPVVANLPTVMKTKYCKLNK